jgi:arsenate reductase
MNLKKPIVLVLCTGNSCRSQMAEAFLRKFHGDRYEVHSAGMAPADRVHPLAVQVMNEIGIDISMARPKDSRAFLGRVPVRHIVIVCDKASQTCPRIWPGVISLNSLPFDDPADFTGTDDEVLDGFRRVRDEIADAMKVWAPEAVGAH